MAVNDKAVAEHMWLVRRIAGKIHARCPYFVELDDLVAAGALGLMDALEKFDKTFACQFKTYAEWRIRGAVLDEIRYQDPIPRSIRDKQKTIDRAAEDLRCTLHRKPKASEIAAKIGITIVEFHGLRETAKSITTVSINESESFSSFEKKSFLRLIQGGKKDPESQVDAKKTREVLLQHIETLPRKERDTLEMYYYRNMTFKEIGVFLCVTESRVSQIHKRAIERLRGRPELKKVS